MMGTLAQSQSQSLFRHLEPAPEVLVPPINFALVVPGVYRSGHPNKKNFGFLKQLKLKGIM